MAVRGGPARWRARCCLMSFVLLPALAAIAAPASVAHRPSADWLGAHSMLYLNHPFGAKETMFREAAAMGASSIRVDVELSGVFPNPDGRADWSGVDQYMLLARRYELRVLAVILATPWYAADCPAGTLIEASYRCPPRDPRSWGAQAGALAAHTRGGIDDFEILNEPDGRWAFLGSPQQYAAMLAASYDAIHAADPGAHVVAGGLMNTGPSGRGWVERVLSARAGGASKFDVANVHVRARAARAGAVVRRWRRFYAGRGFVGPVWVTEAGYPSDPRQQTDPEYRGGAGAQARYLQAAVPGMLHAGAAKIFVTERDATGGPFASEGVLASSDPLGPEPHCVRRPAFYAVRALGVRRGRLHANVQQARSASADGVWSRSASGLPLPSSP
jgi:polysaccharide biosynthesis protein PslG